MKKLSFIALAFVLLTGGLVSSSVFASSPEVGQTADFNSMVGVDEVTPMAVPALAWGAAKIAGAGFVGGFATAAGTWAWDQVTGYFSGDEEEKLQSVNASDVELVFNP